MNSSPAISLNNGDPHQARDAWQRLRGPEVFAALQTRVQGLTAAEAETRLRRYGPNTIREVRGKPLILKFVTNFTHLMALLLWAGGIVALVAGLPQIAIAIWLVNVINGAFSFWQEFKAEKATEALRRLLPHYVRVLRDGQEQRIPAEVLVPGDIILLAEGDQISADARLVQADELKCDQSTLTGESHPVRKTADAVLQANLARAEVPNLVFAGTSVSAGTGRAVVFATGMTTEFGKIADLTQSVGDEPSPLQVEMKRITKVVTLLAVSIGIFFFLAAIFFAKVELATSFVFALGMIVAFVPEGMLPTVTLSLAMGVQRMATIHHDVRGRVAYVKGAPRETLALCTHVWINGRAEPLSAALQEQIMAANDDYARDGLRVLAVAQRELGTDQRSPSQYAPETVERDLTFLGLMAMMDPPRPEVAEAVGRCYRAGIRIIMITGDYGLTAESVARRIGIIHGDQLHTVTGVDLEAMTDDALREVLKGEVLFARAAPEHKLRVVQALQALGHIVAVTGDGVNDAPALKQADIGVAMGIAGTDVAREAADMILIDDNFASIVNAVEEGRTVYGNIRKFALYIFNSNMPEAVPFVIFLFWQGVVPLPLTIMQVLAIDLGTDMVPAIGLGAEPPVTGIMDRPPRARDEPLITGRLLIRALLWYGVFASVASMSAYFFMNWLHGWPQAPLAADGTLVYRMATTMTFAGIVAAQVGMVFNCRSDRVSVFRIGFFSNRLVLVGILVELALLGLLIYIPFLQDIFHTAPIGLREWAFVFAWTPLAILLDETRK